MYTSAEHARPFVGCVKSPEIALKAEVLVLNNVTQQYPVMLEVEWPGKYRYSNLTGA